MSAACYEPCRPTVRQNARSLGPRDTTGQSSPKDDTRSSRLVTPQSIGGLSTPTVVRSWVGRASPHTPPEGRPSLLQVAISGDIFTKQSNQTRFNL